MGLLLYPGLTGEDGPISKLMHTVAGRTVPCRVFDQALLFMLGVDQRPSLVPCHKGLSMGSSHDGR